MDERKAPRSFVTNIDELKDQAGTTARVRGVYVELDVRKAAAGAPVFVGHAAIRLTDDTLVMLAPPNSSEARRTREERDNLRDKEVVAEGVLHETWSSDGATLMNPCFSPLLLVVTPELYELLSG